ncbi:type IV secretion system protein [Providencia rettgeri]
MANEIVVPDYSSDLFQAAHTVIFDMLNKILANKVSEYSGIAADLAQYGISIYILWFAFSTLAMKHKTPVPDFIWNLTRFTIILMFIKNSGGWLDASTQAIYGLRDTLAGGANTWEWMDQLWVKTAQVAKYLKALDTSTYVPADGVVAALSTYLGGLISLMLCALVFFAAEITLLLLTTTAPIFIFCLMFGFLRQMFNNWLQLIFSSLLVVMFGSLALRAGMAFLNIILSSAVIYGKEVNLMEMGVQALVAGLFMGGVIWLAQKYASQIAGAGVDGAVQGMAAMGIVGAGMMALKGAKKAASTVGNVAPSMGKNNRDRGWDGATTSAGGGSSAPNSAKSRRQASIDQVRQRYGT